MTFYYLVLIHFHLINCGMKKIFFGSSLLKELSLEPFLKRFHEGSFFLERKEKCLNTAYVFVFRYYLNWNDVTLFFKTYGLQRKCIITYVYKNNTANLTDF